MLDVTCEHCGHVLRIPEEYLGQWGTCTHCKGRIEVTVKPLAFSEEVIRMEEEASATPLSIQGNEDMHSLPPQGIEWEDSTGRSAGGKGRMITFACPNCGNTLRVPDEYAGRGGICRKCGTRISAPPVFDVPVFQELRVPRAPRSSPRETRSVSRGLLAVFAITVVASLAWFGSSQDRMRRLREVLTPMNTTKPSAGFALPSLGKQIVTFDKYQRILAGMSYQQVLSIIGAQGEELSSSAIEAIPGVMPGIKTVMYQWMNSNGSNMNAIFQNDRLVQKAQFALK